MQYTLPLEREDPAPAFQLTVAARVAVPALRQDTPDSRGKNSPTATTSMPSEPRQNALGYIQSLFHSGGSRRASKSTQPFRNEACPRGSRMPTLASVITRWRRSDALEAGRAA